MDVTLRIEDEIARKAGRIAAEQDTTLAGLVENYLVKLVQGDSTGADDDRKALNRAELERLFSRYDVTPTPRTWTRAELYERS